MELLLCSQTPSFRIKRPLDPMIELSGVTGFFLQAVNKTTSKTSKKNDFFIVQKFSAKVRFILGIFAKIFKYDI